MRLSFAPVACALLSFMWPLFYLWRTPGCDSSAAAIMGWALRHQPHQSVPKSSTVAPLYASTAARAGSVGA